MNINALDNSSNTINISYCRFTPISYKIHRSRNYSKQFTVSGSACLFDKGLDYVNVTVESCFPTDDHTVIPALENAVSASEKFSFIINGMMFENMILAEFSAGNDKNNAICSLTMNFISASSIKENNNADDE